MCCPRPAGFSAASHRPPRTFYTRCVRVRQRGRQKDSRTSGPESREGRGSRGKRAGAVSALWPEGPLILPLYEEALEEPRGLWRAHPGLGLVFWWEVKSGVGFTGGAKTDFASTAFERPAITVWAPARPEDTRVWLLPAPEQRGTGDGGYRCWPAVGWSASALLTASPSSWPTWLSGIPTN